MSYAEIASTHGHDSFLMQHEQYHDVMRAYLDRIATRILGMSAHDPIELAAARPDFAAIAAWIPQGASVLDLGCGDGSLLRYLKDTRKVRGYGVEISDANIVACIRNGVNVIQSDLESGLSGFEISAFDFVLLSQTLQATRHTEPLVQEMLRVGREGIVSFPNFGYWRNRLNVLRGNMPVSQRTALPMVRHAQRAPVHLA